MSAPYEDDPGRAGDAELAALIAPALLPGETVRIHLRGTAVPHALAAVFTCGRPRPLFLALTRHRLILLYPGPPRSGWADPVGRVVVEGFRTKRGGTSRLRLRRLAAPERPIRIRVAEEWRAEAARIAAELPPATPFTLPD